MSLNELGIHVARRGQSVMRHSRITNGWIEAKAAHALTCGAGGGQGIDWWRWLCAFDIWSGVPTQSILQANNVIKDQSSTVGAHCLDGLPVAPVWIQVLVFGQV